MKIEFEVLATEDNFNEEQYFAANPDVAAGARTDDVVLLRARKMDQLRDKRDLSMPHARFGLKYDFLIEELGKEAEISDTKNISTSNYDARSKS
jgi:hypothetical protein